MKRIYEVTIGTDKESATNLYRVYRSNVVDASKAALRAYHSNGDRLYGHARIIEVKETGELNA